MQTLDAALEEAVKEISTNHRKIIDDWCKAYLAELYGLGFDINPGCFTLNQMQINDGNKIGWKYWFTIEGNVMDDYLNIESTIKEMFENACKLILNEKIDEPEFELCKNTIQTTLAYLTGKRKHKEKEH